MQVLPLTMIFDDEQVETLLALVDQLTSFFKNEMTAEYKDPFEMAQSFNNMLKLSNKVNFLNHQGKRNFVEYNNSIPSLQLATNSKER